MGRVPFLESDIAHQQALGIVAVMMARQGRELDEAELVGDRVRGAIGHETAVVEEALAVRDLALVHALDQLHAMLVLDREHGGALLQRQLDEPTPHARLDVFVGADRKSTRLNSSH